MQTAVSTRVRTVRAPPSAAVSSRRLVREIVAMRSGTVGTAAAAAQTAQGRRDRLHRIGFPARQGVMVRRGHEAILHVA